jgi:hypothetical protein
VVLFVRGGADVDAICATTAHAPRDANFSMKRIYQLAKLFNPGNNEECIQEIYCIADLRHAVAEHQMPRSMRLHECLTFLKGCEGRKSESTMNRGRC